MAGGWPGGWLGRNRGFFLGAVVGMLAVGLAALFLPRPTPAPAVVVQQPTPRPSPSPAVVVPIAVHVGGEVAGPGLYRLPPGSRIDDALRAAGGVTPDGDVERVNLAARLADGQQVVVPRKAARAVADGGPVTPAKVNVNTATVAELDVLPGIGPATAQRIVAYREQHGPFERIEQLREAKLVNASTFEKIKDLISTLHAGREVARLP